MGRVLGGDLSAFEGIVRRWEGPLVNLAFRFCRNRARAEEMAQEVFLQVYRRLSTYRGTATFSTWLFAVATNLYRSAGRRLAPPMVGLEDAKELGGARLYRDVLDGSEDREEAVRRAVTHLPERYRSVVLLYYFLETDVARTAAVLGLPEGTVKARLHRAREMLRERLSRRLAFKPGEVEA